MKQFAFFISLWLCSFIANAQGSIARFKVLGNGHWIAQPYIQSLQKTKSPIKTEQTENKLIQLIFPDDGFKDNSIEVDGWTLNEGGLGFTISLKPGIKKDTWKTNAKNYDNADVGFMDIGFSIVKKDTMLLLYKYSKAKKLLGIINYIKSSNAFSSSEETGYLHFQVNKALFAGTWNSKGMNVQFTNDGSVDGFNDAVHYEVEFYAPNPVKQGNKMYDEVTFTNAAGNKEDYLWLMEGNKLMLYERLDKGNYIYKPGKLKYTLVRKQ